APQMALAADADEGPGAARRDAAEAAHRLPSARALPRLLERAGRREGGAARRPHGVPGAAEILHRAGYGLERLGPQNRPRPLEPRLCHGLRRESRRGEAPAARAL